MADCVWEGEMLLLLQQGGRLMWSLGEGGTLL